MPSLAGDVELIVSKAMAKDPAQRYPSAAALAADLRRYCAHEPILARPPSATYQLRRFARRHRGLVLGSAAALLALVAGLVSSLILASQRESARQEAVLQGENAKAARAAALAEAEQARRERDEANALAGFLEELFQDSSPESSMGRERSAKELLLLGLERLEDLPTQEAGRRARLLSALGRTLRNLSEFETAEPLFREALKLQTELHGEEHLDVYATWNDLGVLLRRTGRFEDAIRVYERSLAGRERELGPDHPLVGQTLNNLAVAYDAIGRVEDALPLLQRSIAIQERHHGPRHPDTLLQRINYANQLVPHRPDEAHVRLRDLYPLATEVLGETHVTTLLSGYGFSQSLQWLERYEQSNAVAMDVLERQRLVFGERSLDVATNLHLIGTNHYFLRDFEQALEALHEAHELELEVLGPEHGATLATEVYFVDTMHALGFSEAALELGAESLDKHRRIHGEDHKDTRYLVDSIARIERESGLTAPRR